MPEMPGDRTCLDGDRRAQAWRGDERRGLAEGEKGTSPGRHLVRQEAGGLCAGSWGGVTWTTGSQAS